MSGFLSIVESWYCQTRLYGKTCVAECYCFSGCPRQITGNNIHIKSLINTHALLHIYVIMYATLSCLNWLVQNIVLPYLIVCYDILTSASIERPANC